MFRCSLDSQTCATAMIRKALGSCRTAAKVLSCQKVARNLNDLCSETLELVDTLKWKKTKKHHLSLLCISLSPPKFDEIFE